MRCRLQLHLLAFDSVGVERDKPLPVRDVMSVIDRLTRHRPCTDPLPALDVNTRFNLPAGAAMELALTATFHEQA